LGYQYEEIMSMRLRELLYAEDLERMFKVRDQLASGHGSTAVETRVRCKDGSYKWILWNAVPCLEQQVLFATGQDITQRKQAEEQLRESQERFQMIATATKDAVWDWDLRENRLWRNESYRASFGESNDATESPVEWWRNRIHPDDQERILRSMPPPVNDGGQQWTLEYRLRRIDGTYAHVYDRGFVIFDGDGAPVRMVGTIMDISQRRRAEEMAHMQRAELAHIARVSTMGEIATGLAHELNQPLAAISNYAASCAQAMASGAPGNDKKLLSWIEKIATNTDRAGQMIRRLRSFTRKSEPRRSTVEINELIDEVIDLLEAETRLQNVRVRWQPDGTIHATVDRVQVQQVLVNLLRNAYEAMLGNGPDERQVVIGTQLRGNKVEISVEDAGEGIAAENTDRVFDAFFTSKANGVGIGLAISRSIVEDHGGRLWVNPNPARGVTFRFTLPLSGV
jgi:PAS domain S-box-containing protein